jgi:hypothetical protein
VCETCSLTLREEYRLKVFVKRVLRGIFVPMGDKGVRGNLIKRSFIICTNQQILSQ